MFHQSVLNENAKEKLNVISIWITMTESMRKLATISTRLQTMNYLRHLLQIHLAVIGSKIWLSRRSSLVTTNTTIHSAHRAIANRKLCQRLKWLWLLQKWANRRKEVSFLQLETWYRLLQDSYPTRMGRGKKYLKKLLRSALKLIV